MRYNIPAMNALRVFEAVARHMSFQQAADELHLTPSALSYQIRTLEDQLGQPLFVRGNRAISLTPGGRKLLPAVEDALERIVEGISAISASPDNNRLIVSSGPAFAAKWLAPKLRRFVDAHPDIELLVSANLRNVDFARDDADVGIRFGLGDYPGLEVEPLVDEAALPLCAPELAARLKTPADLASVTLLHDDSIRHLADAPNWSRWLALAGEAGVDASKGLRFTHADHGLDAAIEGAGVVLGRRSLSEADIRHGRLVAPFGLELPIRPRFYLVGPPTAFRLRKVIAFRDWLRSEIAACGNVPAR
ncbi:transcriptional regulator GcvA [Stappia sp.]|uniref:transcriptional regulator GcvA n=1 Tax=Stappia sp. TaxID=1870903 RepID=UPI003D142456